MGSKGVKISLINVHMMAVYSSVMILRASVSPSFCPTVYSSVMILRASVSPSFCPTVYRSVMILRASVSPSFCPYRLQ